MSAWSSFCRATVFSPRPFNNWDTPSVATIARNLIENYHAFFYLCIEKVPDTEWQCRLQLFNLHDCLTRKRILADFQVIGEDLPKFEQQADELREVLKQNNFFQTLSENERKRLLKGEHAFYLTRADIEQRMEAGPSDLKAMYRLLSVQTHTLPMSFYRSIEQRRGTGVETETELHYISMFIEYIIPYLQLAARQIIELYPAARTKLNDQQSALLDEPFIHY